MTPHEFRTLHDMVGRDSRDPAAWYRGAMATMHDPYLQSQARVEAAWIAERRPYYTVYPLAAESLAKITLDVPCSAVSLPISAMLIRFGVGQEPDCAGRKLRSILAGQLTVRGNERGMGCWFDFGESAEMLGRPEFPIYSYLSFSLHFERSVEESLADLDQVEQDNDGDAVTLALRYAVAVCLLAHDPEIIEPDVLGKDRVKWAETRDPAIVERAVRRGKRGWLIGADWEVMPHYRRPHLGLRWTGEGRRIPKIVPIKGAVVHRSKLTEAPQGRIDGEEPAV